MNWRRSACQISGLRNIVDWLFLSDPLDSSCSYWSAAYCLGDASGKDRVGRQDCMQSRQDYTIAVREENNTNSGEDDPGGAARREARAVLRNYMDKCFRSVTCWRHMRSYEQRRFGSAAWQGVR